MEIRIDVSIVRQREEIPCKSGGIILASGSGKSDGCLCRKQLGVLRLAMQAQGDTTKNLNGTRIACGCRFIRKSPKASRAAATVEALLRLLVYPSGAEALVVFAALRHD